jgi:hypothetical protein
MDEAADTADALSDINVLNIVLLLNEPFQSAVNEADGRNGLDYFFVFDHQIDMNRLRKYRVLRAERNDCAVTHDY